MTRQSLLVVFLFTVLQCLAQVPTTTPLVDVILSGAQSIYSGVFPSGSTNLGVLKSDATSLLNDIMPSSSATSTSPTSSSASATSSSTLAKSTSSRSSSTRSHATTRTPTSSSTVAPTSSTASDLPGVDTNHQALIFGLALGIPLGIIALILLILALILLRRRRRKHRETQLVGNDSTTEGPHAGATAPLDASQAYRHHTHDDESGLIHVPAPQMAETDSRRSRYYSTQTSASATNINSRLDPHAQDQEHDSLLTPSTQHHSSSPSAISSNIPTTSHSNPPENPNYAYGQLSQHPHHLSTTSTQHSSYSASDSILGSPTSPAEMEGSSSVWPVLALPRKSSKRKRPTAHRKFHYPFSPTSEEVGSVSPESSTLRNSPGPARGPSFGRSGSAGSGRWFAGLGGGGGGGAAARAAQQQQQEEDLLPQQRARRISEIRRKPVAAQQMISGPWHGGR